VLFLYGACLRKEVSRRRNLFSAISVKECKVGVLWWKLFVRDAASLHTVASHVMPHMKIGIVANIGSTLQVL
jgi:hypothetical protein